MLRLRELDSFLGVVTLMVADKEELPFLSYYSSVQIWLSLSIEWDKFLCEATMDVAAKMESPLSAYSSST